MRVVVEIVVERHEDGLLVEARSENKQTAWLKLPALPKGGNVWPDIFIERRTAIANMIMAALDAAAGWEQT